MSDFDYDIIVLGAGAAGLAVAKKSASFGLKVALAEKGMMGGENWSISTKAIIHAAGIAKSIKKAQSVGLDVELTHFEFKKALDYIQSVNRTVEAHESNKAIEKKSITLLQGFASFTDAHTIDVDGEKFTAKKFCVATGSCTAIPAIEGLKETGCLTVETLFSQEKMPESLLIVGGGPTGLELSQTYARFGCKVTILEIAENLFAKEDPEIGQIMEKVLTDEGIDLILGCKILKFYNKDGKRTALVKHQGTEKEFMADQVLIATGRIPNIATLDLKLARVAYSKKGIRVDEQLRTTSPNIWACGDAVGPYQSAHVAAYQAGIVIANMIFRLPKKVNYDFLPSCIFTDPEVATLGSTENTAKEKGLKCETVRFDFKDLDRAICDDSEIGFLKLLVRKGKIIGATCVGPDAGNIIHELILAASAKLPLSKISKAIHIYPTLAQINLLAANKYLSKKKPGPFSKKWANFTFNLFS